MAFREVRVFEVREVLRVWLGGPGFRSIERWSEWIARRSAAMSRRRWSWDWTVRAARSS